MALKDAFTLTNATALALLMSFFSYGIGCNVYGPTWPDLTRLFNVTDAYMGYAKTSQASAYVVGAMLCSFFFQYVHRNVVICIYLVILGICKGLIPLVGFWGFIALGVTLSIAEGGCDVGFNVSTLSLFEGGRHTGWIMQLMHFMYGLGGLIIFMLCKPFLAPENDDHPPITPNGTIPLPSLKQLLARHPPVPQPSFDSVPFSRNWFVPDPNITHSTSDYLSINSSENIAGHWPVFLASDSSGNSSESGADQPYHTRIQIPYAIVGVIYLFVALYWVPVLLYSQYKSKLNSASSTPSTSSRSSSICEEEEKKEKISSNDRTIKHEISQGGDNYIDDDDTLDLVHDSDQGSEQSDDSANSWVDILRLLLCVLIMGIYNSQESNTFTYLYTYLYYSGIDKETAADMNSVFSLVYNGSRMAAIIAASLFSSKWIIFLCIPFSTASLAGLALFGGGGKGTTFHALPNPQDRTLLTWHLIIALAASYSGVYPAMFPFVNKKVTITDKVGSLIIIVCGTFLATTPMILGNFIHDMPSILPYCLLGHAAIVITCLIILSLLPAPRPPSSLSPPVQSQSSSTNSPLTPSSSATLLVS